MKYIVSTLLYFCIGICLGVGFGNKINEIDSTFQLWLILAAIPVMVSLLLILVEKIAFPIMKFKLIHTFLSIGSSFILTFFFIITSPTLNLIILFVTLPIGSFFAAILVFSRLLHSENFIGSGSKVGNLRDITDGQNYKPKDATMLRGVKEIKEYSDKQK